jgi:hypothetical protein
MGFGSTGGHDLIPDSLWKGDIDQVVPVNVAHFPPSQPKFSLAKAVRLGRHPLPTEHRLSNLLARPPN